ncbi:hypothetical protein ACFC1R_33735 [Kitasatospora sp. NPDC056138]|uniref:hypothetical protein n=1 Tax=Kitasatospora sp. NPDC056138 TaxID=3345724 RepID=UPI0035D5FEFE
MADDRRRLLIIERAYRGALETQFADVLYLARELNRQQGGTDILLRGLAVTYAAAGAGPAPAVTVGSRKLETLPAPRDSVQSLLDHGATVWAEEVDLAAFETGPHWLRPGVRRAGPADPLPDWSSYRGVYFL